ncbi:MAG: hypothetical protein SWJ54_15830 [Cyanobacteriota bacterium]|nr:hypothetical protein [Cyanobacteriota bacterium]
MDNADLVTADISISGSIADDNAIATLRVGLDDTPIEAFSDITERLGENQQFVLTPATLEPTFRTSRCSIKSYRGGRMIA